MPRSKIFSLPKLRGRSRSVAAGKRGGRRLDDEPTAALNKTLSSSTTASPERQGERAKSPAQSAATTTAGAQRGRGKGSPQNPTPNAYAHTRDEAPRALSPTPLGMHRGATDSSRDTNISGYSNVSYDQSTASSEAAFTSAFNRSPPSFDNLDTDILSDEGGVFSARTHSSASRTLSSGEGSFPAAHSHPHGSQGHKINHVGPNGIQWGDSSVQGGSNEHPDDENSMVYSQMTETVESADPPATLLLEDDDLIDASAGGVPTNEPSGAHVHWGEKQEVHKIPTEETSTQRDMFDAFGSAGWNQDENDEGEGRRNKNRRLVSPSPVKKDQKQLDADLSAWGDFDGNLFSGFGGEPTNNEAGSGFDDNGFDDDGFDDVNNFFSGSWTDVGAGQNKMVKQHSSNTDESDPWAETSFVTGSFNYSMSNEESRQGSAGRGIFEEKKDDENAFHRGADPPTRKNDPPSAASSPGIAQKDDPPTASSSPSEDLSGAAVPWPSPVWDGPTSKGEKQASHPLTEKQHPLKQQPMQAQDAEGNEVAFSFEGLANRPPARLEERKASHGSRISQLTNGTAAATPTSIASQQRHRRMGSNGSQSSKLSRQSQQRRAKKGGGSVGSNSSAVDQILEHYRQKRRNRDRLGNYAAGGSVIGSVQSGGQVGGNAGNSVGAANQAAQRHHRRNPSSGSSSSRQHRRNPSNESVSRIIDNLGSAAAATPALASAATRPNAPSPVLAGKYQPPSTTINTSDGDDAASDRFLLANIEATIGPRGAAPDMESLSGRSSARSNRHSARSSSRRPNRSPTRRTDASVDSRASRGSRVSRNSFRTYQSTRSQLTNMSRETQSVANDLFRLEAQLAEQVARQQMEEGTDAKDSSAAKEAIIGTVTNSSSGELSAVNDPDTSGSTLGAEPPPRHMPYEVVAPPGKLGIILSNRPGRARGPTHVSAVRSESVLAGRVHVGDIFVGIDGEDVTALNSKEITSVMTRKSEFERVLKFRPQVVDSGSSWI